jgi:hypothetical protein
MNFEGFLRVAGFLSRCCIGLAIDELPDDSDLEESAQRKSSPGLAYHVKKKSDKQFHERYVDAVYDDISKGKSHSTLGRNLKGQPFKESGLNVFNFLKTEGIKPEHICVEYGCGSLRAAQHFINYLNPSNFWGLDVTDKFYEIGKEMIGQKLLQKKLPHFRIISPATLAEVNQSHPDYLFAVLVMIHIPPSEIEEFLSNILKVCVKTTRAYISVDVSAITFKPHPNAWVFSKKELAAFLDKFPINYSFLDASSVDFDKNRIEKKWIKLMLK